MAGLTGMGVSVVAFIAGAIMKFAVTVHATGFNINKIGVILMIAGAVGFVISVILFASTRSAVVPTSHSVHSETRDSSGNAVVTDKTVN
jgi:phosphate/sulfate permease